MAKIIISTNATLDGVVQDPDGKEGTAFGGWFGQHVGTDFDAWSEREIDEAVQFALDSPYPDAAELYRDVYAEELPA